MRVEEYCSRNAVVVNASADISDAAKLMRKNHVGFLVVLDESNPQKPPIGVITDRDIVVQVDAKEIDPKSLKVSEVMSRNPVVAQCRDNMLDLVKAMHSAGIRRMPVVNAAGALTGVIALDDVLGWITALLCDVTGTLANEQRTERRLRMS